ncbi:TKL protein kinase [Fonticula alba]|uniref:TKL protein kinase n=1 Tax=Fonticula alba TaxID=691883 RepID=A0A058ZB00_FONAL|nr:TKL protein kinase [Fonticula alba]KCV71600.1 TKL protein kinase [Fonticula alba]|eukprot:XP_009494723.1 TKL protein kinase [Fonticula alba]
MSCVEACPEGHWSSGGLCTVCGDGCQACSEASKCDRCQEQHFADGNGACRQCGDMCASCSGPQTCDACLPGGYFLSPDAQVASPCVGVCPEGRFADAVSGRCASCPTECGTCVSAVECDSCAPGHGWIPRSAVECSACPEKCDSCARSTACDTCAEGFFVTSTGGCAATCPAGAFADVATGRCAPCDATCSRCEGASACSTCEEPLVFLGAIGQSLCVGVCPAGLFAEAGRCMECHASCDLCTGAANRCQACAPGFRWADGAPGAGGSGMCTACPDGCRACDRDICIDCEEELFLTHQGACVAECPAGTFGDGQSMTCQPCALECDTCAGDGAGRCTACSPGLDAVPAEGPWVTCVPACDPGKYRDPVGQQCVSCDASCLTCNGPSDGDCWQCPANGQVLQDGMCQIECAPGFVPVAGRCLPCHASCRTCSGRRLDECTECREGLQALPADGPTGRCVNACPLGSSQTASGCVACGAHCSSCPDGAAMCSVCARGWLRAGGACIEACPGRSFPFGGQCDQCHESCSTCSKHGPEHCLACEVATRLLYDGQCMVACPVGTFPEAMSCLRCHATCASCTGPRSTECTSCHAGGFLHDNACLSACLAGYYGDAHGACHRCHESCLTCTGPGSKGCTACRDPGLLDRGQCVADCPAGRYSCMGSCAACGEQCARCTAMANGAEPGCRGACDECEPGSVLAFASGQCVDTCPEGEFQQATGVCAPCESPCHTCDGEATRCTSCRDASLWLHVDAGVCASECPERGRAPAELTPGPGRVCLPCPRDCLRCEYAAQGGCLLRPGGAAACPAGVVCTWCDESFLRGADGACVADCPAAGFFADREAAPPACMACHARCEACTGPDAEDCLAGGWSGRRVALALGLGLGLLLLVLLALLVVFLFVRLRRRRGARAKENLDALDDDSTMMNTIVELSLPGSILVNVAQDFAPIGGDPLGAGTQASVFAARVVGPGIGERLGCTGTVAIKQMKVARMRPAQHALFQGEVALMWLLREAPNVVRLYGYSEQPPAIVMECFETDLRELLHSEVPLAEASLLDICQQWASGLEAMHLAGVAHCDLKPGNVFISPGPGAGWRAALRDLGTSRNLNANRMSALVSRAPELNALTARYAGPEVLAAFRHKRSMDPALFLMADVYSAAIMLWECLTRRLPWAGMGFEDIASSVLAGERPAVSFSGPLADLLAMAWDGEPHSRPPVVALRQKLAMACIAASNASSE